MDGNRFSHFYVSLLNISHLYRGEFPHLVRDLVHWKHIYYLPSSQQALFSKAVTANKIIKVIFTILGDMLMKSLNIDLLQS